MLKLNPNNPNRRAARALTIIALALLTLPLGSSLASAGNEMVWVAPQGRQRFTNEVVAGKEGNRKLTVCRANYRGGQHPGKVVAFKCNFGYGGKEIEATKYEVLVSRSGVRPKWSATSNSLAPGAFRAARYDGRQGHVCRGQYRGGTHPGKVVAGKCNIGYGGKEVLLEKFQTLLSPTRVKPAPARAVPVVNKINPTPRLQKPRAPALSWVAPRRGQRTPGAVSGGREGNRDLTICRAKHRGGSHPGKVVAGKCNFGYGGREIQGVSYEVLVARPGTQAKWSTPTAGLAQNAFPASKYDGKQGYVCRAQYRGGTHPGKVVAGKCNIGYGGKEILLGRFQTLLQPRINRVKQRPTPQLRAVPTLRPTPNKLPSPPPNAMVWVTPRAGKRYGGEVIAGKEGNRKLAVCRAKHRGGQHPGKIVAGKCNFGYGGREIEAVEYEVLVTRQGVRPRWSANVSRLPAHAFPASRYDGAQGYVCRGMHRGSMHPGKVVASRCNIGYGGREVLISNYQVLLSN